MNKTTFDTRMDEAVFNAVVAKGVRENGTVLDLDTLIVDRQKLEDNIRTLVNDVCMEVIGEDTFPEKHELSRSKYFYKNELRATQRTKLATILGADTNQLEKGTE